MSGACSDCGHDDCQCEAVTYVAPMSRRKEVEALGGAFHTEENWNTILYKRCRALADEVDARDAIIDKLLADLAAPHSRWQSCPIEGTNYGRVIQGGAELFQGYIAVCDRIAGDHNGDIDRLHARACEIAGRKS